MHFYSPQTLGYNDKMYRGISNMFPSENFLWQPKKKLNEKPITELNIRVVTPRNYRWGGGEDIEQAASNEAAWEKEK